jgi:hypothetical protein
MPGVRADGGHPVAGSQGGGVLAGHVQAGNLYVNRVITGAIVRRQPFGGWKRSAVGAGRKAGGPNYLFGLGSWEPVPVEPEIAAEPSGGSVRWWTWTRRRRRTPPPTRRRDRRRCAPSSRSRRRR